MADDQSTVGNPARSPKDEKERVSPQVKATNGHTKPGTKSFEVLDKQVKATKDGSGVGDMTVDKLLDFLRTHAVEVVKAVKSEKYTSQPVCRIMIPKGEKEKFRLQEVPTALN